MKMMIEIDKIDKGILPAVEILRKHGFQTFESCEGGSGHCFEEATILFYGEEFDCIRAYEVCQYYGLNVRAAYRVYHKDVDLDPYNLDKKFPSGYVWGKPYNQLVFLKHPDTGTIFLPTKKA